MHTDGCCFWALLRLLLLTRVRVMYEMGRHRGLYPRCQVVGGPLRSAERHAAAGAPAAGAAGCGLLKTPLAAAAAAGAGGAAAVATAVAVSAAVAAHHGEAGP